MIRTICGVVLSLSIGGPLASQEFEVDQARLDALRDEVLSELEKEFEPLEEPVAVRVATRAEIEDTLALENEGLMRHQVAEDGDAKEAARTFARALAPIILGKYAFRTREILIVPENFAFVSELLGIPELQSEGVLRAVLVHEYVHAFDDRTYDLDGTYPKLTDIDSVHGFNAVMEGHAQHVSRRIATRAGWLAGFETYTHAIDAPPADGETAVEELGRKVVTAMIGAYYTEGERFFAAIEEAGGKAAVERAFAAPPRDLATIYEPDWFLDPSTRPALRYDFEAALKRAAEPFPAPSWNTQRISLTKAQLEAALSVLPAEVAQGAVRSMRTGRALVCASTDRSEGQVIAALLEFPSPAEARLFSEANRQALVKKDELMKEGPARIVSAEYVEVDEEGLVGVIARKVISAGGQELRAITLLGRFESLALEINFVDRETSDEELVAWCLELLEQSLPGAAPEEAAGDPSGDQ